MQGINDSEELQLSPKKPDLVNKNKNILSWAKQGDETMRGLADRAGGEDEQLNLSPNENSSRPVAPGSNAPAWSKQATHSVVKCSNQF